MDERRGIDLRKDRWFYWRFIEDNIKYDIAGEDVDNQDFEGSNFEFRYIYHIL